MIALVLGIAIGIAVGAGVATYRNHLVPVLDASAREQLRAWHTALPWGCNAYDEGRSCCVDALVEKPAQSPCQTCGQVPTFITVPVHLLTEAKYQPAPGSHPCPACGVPVAPKGQP